MYKKILVIALVLLLLTGCKKDSELVEPYKMTNKFSETLMSYSEQGLYEIENRDTNKQFIIYRGVQNGIKSMSYSVKNEVLTISLESVKIEKPQDYVYKINSNSFFDTLIVSIDGKDEVFKTIFVQ